MKFDVFQNGQQQIPERVLAGVFVGDDVGGQCFQEGLVVGLQQHGNVTVSIAES